MVPSTATSYWTVRWIPPDGLWMHAFGLLHSALARHHQTVRCIRPDGLIEHNMHRCVGVKL